MKFYIFIVNVLYCSKISTIILYSKSFYTDNAGKCSPDCNVSVALINDLIVFRNASGKLAALMKEKG